MNGILAIAQKEWQDGWRNRWLAGTTLIFILMALGLAWFGAAASGQTGLAPLSATLTSLSSLAVLIIPLIALLLGFESFVGEQEQGTLLLLLSYPVHRWQVMLGKYLGQSAILTTAVLLGFGTASGFLVWAGSVTEGSGISLAHFALSAVLLGLVFLAIAHFISLICSEKSKAAGLALLVWFLFTLVYDLGLLALLVGTQGWLNESFLRFALMANPTDTFRMINLLNLEGTNSGVFAQLSQWQLSAWALYLILLGWSLGFLGLNSICLTRKSL